jgi:pimeloyl-ACP methyl ester carboxylesterase
MVASSPSPATGLPDIDSITGDPEDVFEVRIHGHRVCFRLAGSGPLIVLVHGITGRSEQWVPVIDALRDRYTLFAPDLLGHGESAKPRGDYSLGAFASGIRDLLLHGGSPLGPPLVASYGNAGLEPIATYWIYLAIFVVVFLVATWAVLARTATRSPR